MPGELTRLRLVDGRYRVGIRLGLAVVATLLAIEAFRLFLVLAVELFRGACPDRNSVYVASMNLTFMHQRGPYRSKFTAISAEAGE